MTRAWLIAALLTLPTAIDGRAGGGVPATTTAPAAVPGGLAQGSDLDAFMARVLARRDDNWKKLQQYVLDEHERLALSGPDGSLLYGFRRDYTWFIRQGVFVRSPTRVNGITIGEADRREHEKDWLAREQRRERRAEQRARAESPDGNSPEAAPVPPTASTGSVEDVLKQSLEPRFVSAAYFLRFRFDPGHYALGGRERLLDRDLLKIEYYPSLLFREGRTRPNKRVRDRGDEIEEKMNKVSLVTLWIDPVEHQILRYTFENIDMDFLPGRSLVRVDEVKASMAMSEPFPAVWLPATVDMQFRIMTAVGPVAARYDVEYRDYRLAEVSVRIKP
ncbi:MAG: hypothetical protein ACT4QD_08145 [Acidobacteriota bacterium]